MNLKQSTELPKNYTFSKDWRLLVIVPVMILAFADVFLQQHLDFGLLYAITSALFGLFMLAEVISRIKFKRTPLGFNLAFYVAIAYALGDLFIYGTNAFLY